MKMKERTCNTCLFLDQCTHITVCDNWSPGYEVAEYQLMQELIDEMWSQIRIDWIRYVSEELE